MIMLQYNFKYIRFTLINLFKYLLLQLSNILFVWLTYISFSYKFTIINIIVFTMYCV